jgi:hypothetical protein
LVNPLEIDEPTENRNQEDEWGMKKRRRSGLSAWMHMGVSGSATTATNVFAATSGFALIGAFLSDSYITRSRTMLLFGPFMFLVI